MYRWRKTWEETSEASHEQRDGIEGDDNNPPSLKCKRESGNQVTENATDATLGSADCRRTVRSRESALFWEARKARLHLRERQPFARWTGMGKTKVQDSEESSAIGQVTEHESLNRVLANGREENVFREVAPLGLGNLVKPDMQLSTEKGNAVGRAGLDMQRRWCVRFYTLCPSDVSEDRHLVARIWIWGPGWRCWILESITMGISKNNYKAITLMKVWC